MRRGSITAKLLFFIVGAFIVTTVSVLFVGNIKLHDIIDESQHALYEEKVEVILASLRRSNERLNKTGLVEAYTDDFKEASLKILRETHYNSADQTIYPFIIDAEDGSTIMHPVLPKGDKTLVKMNFVGKVLAANHGDFDYTNLGQEQWYHFKRFPEWNWVVCYTVPLDVKYSDVRKFRNLLIYIMGGITLLVLLVLSMIIARFTRPIVRLTHISTAIADGDLDQQIDLGGADEIGILARSFSHMRDSIRRTISDLEKENSERRKVEGKLVQQNEYINSIFESVTHPLYAIDVIDYSVQMANSASGFHAGSARTCYEFTHHRDSPCAGGEHPCPLEVVKQTKKPTMVEHVHFDGDGNARNIEVYAYPVFDGTGELIQMIEYGIDVTERKHALEDLASEKEMLAVTLRSIGDGVITADISGTVLLLNKVAEDLTGRKNEEAAGCPLEEVLRLVDRKTGEPSENIFANVVKGGQIVELSKAAVLIARDGTKRSVEESGAPIRDEKSNIIGVVVVFRDITEKVRTEGELLKVKKLESIGVLAGGIAHDFNNILAAILGNISLAQYDAELSAETRNLLSDAEKASLRAKDLTQQLLTFAKGGDPVKETSSLENIIRDSADFVLHGDKVACRYTFPEDLWLVDIDKGQISQVVQNVVLNASNAMPEGGVIRIISENIVFADKDISPIGGEGRFVKISIEDSGIGIPQNLIDKIFDPYFSTKQEGSGLGLAITQSIIRKHGGHITVESSPGKGTSFTLYIPASEKKEESYAEPQTDTMVLSRAKIMIMDDEEMVRTIVGRMLTKLGHEVVLAKDGGEAISLFEKASRTGEKFDLVFMDLTIPGGTGGEPAVKEILKIDSAARVVVSSGYSNDPIMSNFKEYGFCSAIVKPYRLEELSALVSRILN